MQIKDCAYFVQVNGISVGCNGLSAATQLVNAIVQPADTVKEKADAPPPVTIPTIQMSDRLAESWRKIASKVQPDREYTASELARMTRIGAQGIGRFIPFLDNAVLRSTSKNAAPAILTNLYTKGVNDDKKRTYSFSAAFVEVGRSL